MSEHIIAASVVAAPSLSGSEVANALWKYVQAGSLELETTLKRYEEAVGLIDDFAPDRELATEALAEAIRYRHPVYDPIYAVLARRTGCALLTMDSRLRALLSQMGIPAVQARAQTSFLVPKLLLGHRSSSKLCFAQRRPGLAAGPKQAALPQAPSPPSPQAPAYPGARPPASALLSRKP